MINRGISTFDICDMRWLLVFLLANQYNASLLARVRVFGKCQSEDRAYAPPVTSFQTDTRICPRINFVICELEVCIFLHNYKASFYQFLHREKARFKLCNLKKKSSKINRTYIMPRPAGKEWKGKSRVE